VEPARWYYWADKLGLMWQDMPSLDVSLDIPVGPARIRLHREPTSRRSGRCRSAAQCHLVISWVVFSEGWGGYTPPGPNVKARAGANGGRE
jgi:hypothetical protein